MGAPEGFHPLVESVTPSLFRRALLLTHDWHLAEDLVQETVMTILTKWRHVERADNPEAYCSQLMTNKFLSMSRKRSYHEKPDPIEVPQSVDPWPSIEAEISVAEALSTLSPDERAVVIGRYIDDISAVDLAKHLGKTASWVRVNAHRALTKMRMDLTRDDDLVAHADQIAASERRGR